MNYTEIFQFESWDQKNMELIVLDFSLWYLERETSSMKKYQNYV